MNEQNLLTRALQFALSFPSDAAHGEDHITRVIKNARMLTLDYPTADTLALNLACALHDCAMAEQIRDSSVHHASYGAFKAAIWMAGEGLDKTLIDKVSRIIASHSSRQMCEQNGIEAQILFDADKLDMTGAIGISRAIIYAGDNNFPLVNGTDNCLAGVIRQDIEFVEQGLFTQKAREIARERLKFSRAYLDKLLNESE